MKKYIYKYIQFFPSETNKKNPKQISIWNLSQFINMLQNILSKISLVTGLLLNKSKPRVKSH